MVALTMTLVFDLVSLIAYTSTRHTISKKTPLTQLAICSNTVAHTRHPPRHPDQVSRIGLWK